MHSSNNFIFVSFVFALLIFSNSMMAFGQNNLSTTANTPPTTTTTTTTTNNIPSLSMKWGLNGEIFQDLKARLVTLPVSFNPDGSNTVVNDPNFSFTTDLWPVINHSASLNTAFGASSMQPSSVAITLKTVLNPTQATNINNMQLGTTYQLPLSAQDAGQLRNFLVSSDIPSGHYLVDVSSNYGNLDAVYSGKLFILSTSPIQPASTLNTVTKIVTNVIDECPKGQILKDGLCSGPSENGKCPSPDQKISNDICSGPPTKGCPEELQQIGNQCVSNPTHVTECPDGSEPPENGQCASDPTPVRICDDGQPPQSDGTCADGSTPKNKQLCDDGQPPQSDGTCADGSTPKDDTICDDGTPPENGQCISELVTKQLCDNDEPPQSDGTCADGSEPKDLVTCPEGQFEGDFCVSDQIDQCTMPEQHLVGNKCVGPKLKDGKCPAGYEMDKKKCVPVEEFMYGQSAACPEEQLTSDGLCAADPSIDEAESDRADCPEGQIAEDGQCLTETNSSTGNEGDQGDTNGNEGDQGNDLDNDSIENDDA